MQITLSAFNKTTKTSKSKRRKGQTMKNIQDNEKISFLDLKFDMSK